MLIYSKSEKGFKDLGVLFDLFEAGILEVIEEVIIPTVIIQQGKDKEMIIMMEIIILNGKLLLIMLKHGEYRMKKKKKSHMDGELKKLNKMILGVALQLMSTSQVDGVQ